MPRFRAEMGDIDHGCRIAGQHAQNLSTLHGFEALARLEDRQRTQQADRIEFDIGLHARLRLPRGGEMGLLSPSCSKAVMG